MLPHSQDSQPILTDFRNPAPCSSFFQAALSNARDYSVSKNLSGSAFSTGGSLFGRRAFPGNIGCGVEKREKINYNNTLEVIA